MPIIPQRKDGTPFPDPMLSLEIEHGSSDDNGGMVIVTIFVILCFIGIGILIGYGIWGRG